MKQGGEWIQMYHKIVEEALQLSLTRKILYHGACPKHLSTKVGSDLS